MEKSQERRKKKERRKEEWEGMGKDKIQSMFLAVSGVFCFFCFIKETIARNKRFQLRYWFLQKFKFACILLTI